MTSIEWTDATWNPIVGCSRVSAGCERCYAERFVHRGMAEQHRGLTRATSRGPVWTGEVRFVSEKLDEPLRWRKPRRVFVNSLSDLFHESVTDETIDRVFAVMALSPAHTFQVLTKRADRMRAYATSRDRRERVEEAALRGERLSNRLDPTAFLPWPLPNVWLGVSCEDQEAADERVPLLLQTPAAVRFVSAEPLLGPIDFERIRWDAAPFGHVDVLRRGAWSDGPRGFVNHSGMNGLDWIIVGGESGPGARTCDVGWIRSIVEQTRDAGVACFVKQLGAVPVTANANADEWPDDARLEGFGDGAAAARALLRDRKGGDPAEWPEDLRVREFPRGAK